MDKLHIDIETRSAVELSQAGVYRYAEDDSTVILCVAWAKNEGPVHLWIPAEPADIPTSAIPQLHAEQHIAFGEWCPPPLAAALADPGTTLCAHNASFERTLLNAPFARRCGVPSTTIDRWQCSMAQAQTCALPADLATLGPLAGQPKLDTGRRVMLRLSRPDWLGEYVSPHDEPHNFELLYRYCIQDVIAERAVTNRFPAMSAREQRVYHISEQINDAGVRVDLPAVHAAVRLWEQAQERMEREITEVTAGIRPSQTGKLAEWVRAQGYDIENLRAEVVAGALSDLVGRPDLAHVHRVLSLRTMHQAKAPMKYQAIARSVCADGRLRGMFRYHAASTGRWSSTIVQLQNIYRGDLKPCDVDTAIRCYLLHDLDQLQWLFDHLPVAKVFASTVRGMLIPSEGEYLLAADFSQIEARVLPWLAGQDDKIEAFRQGRKLYESVAAVMFNVNEADVTPTQRLLGKICELACGYQGGEAAVLRTAKAFGASIGEEKGHSAKKASGLVSQWRLANPSIVQFWWALERAFKSAMRTGAKAQAGPHIAMKLVGEFMCVRLPSGRLLRYFRPSFSPTGGIQYQGIDTYTRRFQTTETYGGKLAENVTQAVARDVLVEALLSAVAAGYKVIGTVHDELLAEASPEALGPLLDIMRTTPKWAPGLPLDATGYADVRYKKD